MKRKLSASFSAAAIALLVALLVANEARAGARAKLTDICRGCIASVSQASEPAPLLVTLHGDWGAMAPELHAAWERFAAPRGVALLSLTCPADLGCQRSWWQWNGDPAWITEQIDRLAARRMIDRERMWIAGWSGGASYLGMRTQELERTFAAMVIHGGGMWPSRGGCSPEKAPIVFLVGDRNPLHAHALKLREHYESCGNEVSFMLLHGAEHTAEWAALDKRGGEILDLLATKRRSLVAAAEPAAVAEQPLAPSSSASPLSPTASASAPRAPGPAPLPPRGGCGCRAAPRSAPSAWLIAAILALAVAIRRR